MEELLKQKIEKLDRTGYDNGWIDCLKWIKTFTESGKLIPQKTETSIKWKKISQGIYKRLD